MKFDKNIIINIEKSLILKKKNLKKIEQKMASIK
jgi:hypothetical protein